MTKWIDTDNGARTIQSIARNLERLEPITPRDLFAGLAMQAYLMGELPSPARELAIDAYYVADAMMEARKK